MCVCWKSALTAGVGLKSRNCAVPFSQNKSKGREISKADSLVCPKEELSG